MSKKLLFISLITLSCLLISGCASSPLDFLWNKGGDSKAQQTQKTQLNETMGAKVYISNDPFISLPDLENEENQICENGVCYIDPKKISNVKNNDGKNRLELIKNGDKEKEITLDDGRTIKIPANAYYIVLYTWKKSTFQTTITDIINEISASKEAYGKYLIYGGIAIIVIFGLLGWFTKAFGFIGLGLVLGAATAGIAYYPWVSLVIIGFALISTIGYTLMELRTKSTDTKRVKILIIKIEELERENKILRGLMDPKDMTLLETQLRK